MNYLYETHLHTRQASSCAISRGREYIQGYKDAGYDGIIVTDHFYNGNSAIRRYINWADWVNEFCRGYEDAYNEGLRYNLDVFFGWEESFDGDDYLIYGLDKQWLLQHPEARTWTRVDQYETVKYYGGAVVHAHPFRQTSYIQQIHLAPTLIDAVEVANAGNSDSVYNALALRYARKLGLPGTAGSDIHTAQQLKTNAIFGVYLTEKMRTINDYVNALKSNTLAGIRAHSRCFSHSDSAYWNTSICIHDSNDTITDEDIQTFLD
jgi:histidinol phosphatase-like PHP family hydrolase